MVNPAGGAAPSAVWRHRVEGDRRIRAQQFREKVEMRQGPVAELVGHSFACPFDLHALLPVPQSIVLLGPAHPDALAWLSAHWGVTDRLRQVAARDKASTGRRLQRGHAVVGYGFFTEGETPDAAIARLAARSPALRFVLQPRPAIGWTRRMSARLCRRRAKTDPGQGRGIPSSCTERFAGPRGHLLTLARAQQIDLSAISFAALVDQLAAGSGRGGGKYHWARKATG